MSERRACSIPSPLPREGGARGKAPKGTGREAAIPAIFVFLLLRVREIPECVSDWLREHVTFWGKDQWRRGRRRLMEVIILGIRREGEAGAGKKKTFCEERTRCDGTRRTTAKGNEETNDGRGKDLFLSPQNGRGYLAC